MKDLWTPSRVLELWACIEGEGRLRPVGFKRSGGEVLDGGDEAVQAQAYVVATPGYEIAYPALLDKWLRGADSRGFWSWRSYQPYGSRRFAFTPNFERVVEALGWGRFRRKSPEATCGEVCRWFEGLLADRLREEPFVPISANAERLCEAEEVEIVVAEVGRL